MAKVIDYINQHSSEKIMLDEIAQVGHLSTGYLSRTFSKQMGMSVMEYVNYIRLKRAYEMITNTDKILRLSLI
ncbi:helix-turn-helix domain-containing protein [Companilactobacillus paralimentarius]|uniref:helix-turn-helix domain-containing protein n=1 Tax=Companilactobacillus paralimentarius TaxID=83526 RepID=UPI0012AA5620|nr:helix-turn-helix domain-containing protein [Companilactobacillus paralimentarius]